MKDPNDDRAVGYEVVRAFVAAHRNERPAAGARERAIAAVSERLEVPRARRVGRSVGVALAFAAAALVLGGGVIIGRTMQETDAARARAEAQYLMGAKEAEVLKLTSEVQVLREALAKATSQAEAAQLQVALEAKSALLQKRTDGHLARSAASGGGGAAGSGYPTVTGGRAGTTLHASPKPACMCQPGDALCSCL